MKKVLLSAITVLGLLSTQASAESIIGIRMLAVSGCSVTTFQSELANKAITNKFTVSNKYNYSKVYTATVSRADWLTTLKAYDTEILGYTKQGKTIPVAIKSKFNTIINSIKPLVETPCAKVQGVSATADYAMTPNGGSVEFGINYGSSATAYQTTSANTTIVMIDQVSSSTAIYPGHTLIPGTSMAAGLPSISTEMNYASHGNNMSYIISMVSAGLPVTAVALTSGTTYSMTQERLAQGIKYGINEAVKNGIWGSVMNVSIASSHGYSPTADAAASAYVKAGGVFVGAMGNGGGETWGGNTYNKDLMRVGASINGKMITDYGIEGPDLIVPLDGFSTLPVVDGSNKIVNARSYGGSGATAIVSGLVAIMRNQYNNLTPKQIKEAFCETAVQLPIIEASVPNAAEENKKNSYIRCGTVNFEEAMKYVKDKYVSPRYTVGEWRSYWYFYGWNIGINEKLHRALVQGCSLAGGNTRFSIRDGWYPYNCISNVDSTSTINFRVYGAPVEVIPGKTLPPGFDNGWIFSPYPNGPTQ